MTGDTIRRPGSRAVWLAGAFLALAVAGGAYGYLGVSHPAQAQTAATPPPPVTVAKPLRRDLIETLPA